MKILIVVAHPDDEVLGCGGTIARLTREEHEVYCMFLGEGITARYRQQEPAAEDELVQIRHEAEQVALLLGIKEVFFQNLPDNRFDDIPLLDIVKIIETLLDKLQPEVIYTHHGGDLNVDHRLTHQAVLTAARPIKDYPVHKIYAFEIPSSTEWAFQQFEPVFHPNVFMDISETLETKIRAMQLYKSESRPFPHPRSPEALRAIAMKWGSTVGYEAAEAFEMVRAIK